MNVVAVKWSIEDNDCHIRDATHIHEVLVVGGEPAVDDLVIEDLQQSDQHQHGHVHEELQQRVGLDLEASGQAVVPRAPLFVRFS